MMMRALLLAAFAAAHGASAVAAQGPPPSVPQSLSLEDAIELARRYSPAYRQVANDRGAAAWGVRNAYASFIPQFSASGGLTYRGSGSQTFLTQEFRQPSATIGSSYFLGLSLALSGQTLMQPGLARARQRAAEAGVLGAGVSLEAGIRQQYLAALQAEAQVGLAELQLRRNEEFLRLARARFDVGQNTMLDVRQAEVARGQAEVALLQARQAVVVEKLRLFQQMGVAPPDDPSVVILSDSFPIVAPEWTLANLLSEAEHRNPTLEALRARGAAARAGERAAKSQWLPTLSLSAGWSGFTQQFTNTDFAAENALAAAQASAAECRFVNRSLLNPGETPLPCTETVTPEMEQQIRAGVQAQNRGFPFEFRNNPFSASVQVSLPLFTQFGRPFQIAEASAQADDAAEAVRARALELRTEVSQAFYALRTAYETLAIQENNRVAGQDQLRLATERYRVGSGTFFELLDAQLVAQRAEADHINAVYAYHRAIAALEAAVGRPLR